MREDAGRGYRRVVPSPHPLEIVELDVVNLLLEHGVLVIAGGGGGIPVVRSGRRLRGVDAVIDKDHSSALLGEGIGARRMVIVTGVPCAYRNFGRNDQQPIGRVSTAEAQRLVQQGHFASGSMRPKVEAAIRFAQRPGSQTIICSPDNLAACAPRGRRLCDTGLIMTKSYNCVIMGAAGRDFHDFQTFFRDNPQFRVHAFTATQIPFIESRVFPQSLAGASYDGDIPIFAESELPRLIRDLKIDFVFLAYSDLAHEEVMHKASLAQANGASFILLGPQHTQLVADKPVISVTAVRTGAGKSPLSQWIARRLAQQGRQIGVLRHPMPYGDLQRQRVQRFATAEDLDRQQCTVEEREEYEPYIEQNLVVYAGVDYREILSLAEGESDVILWDGGNNDWSFIRPGLSLVVADALRPGHEVRYYPGETNFRAADVIVINKVAQARADDVWRYSPRRGGVEPVGRDHRVRFGDRSRTPRAHHRPPGCCGGRRPDPHARGNDIRRRQVGRQQARSGGNHRPETVCRRQHRARFA